MLTGIFLRLHSNNFFLALHIDFTLGENLLLFGGGLVSKRSLVVKLFSESATIQITMTLTSPFTFLSLCFLGLMTTFFGDALWVVIRARPWTNIWHGIFNLIEFSRTNLAVCIEWWFWDNKTTRRLISIIINFVNV